MKSSRLEKDQKIEDHIIRDIFYNKNLLSIIVL